MDRFSSHEVNRHVIFIGAGAICLHGYFIVVVLKNLPLHCEKTKAGLRC
jgi:hypothetical protein